MSARHLLSIATVISALVVLGCDRGTSDQGEFPSIANPGAAGSTSSGVSGSSPMMGGAPAAPVAGSTANAGAPAAGAGVGGEEPAMQDPTAGTGAEMPDASAMHDPDAAVIDPVDIPDPVAAPFVWGYGIGITDVPAAVAFYTEVMKMTVEKEVVRGDRTDTVLYSTQANRGGRLVLMHFDDGRATRNITAKLVWQSSNAAAVNRAARMHPDYVSRLNFGIVQFDGPETYIQEVGGIFDTDAAAAGITVPYLIAMGFAVSDLSASRRFYVDALRTTESRLGTFSVTDATGAGTITEYSYRYPDGPGIVLQSWVPARNAMDNPVMLVLFVPDAQAVADAIAANGGTIVEPAARSAAYDNRLLIVAKDPDGYLLELVQ